MPMHAAYMGETGYAYRVLVGKLEGRHLEDQRIDETAISKWNLKKWDVKMWTGLFWLMIGTSGRLL
jgi:hypothetical protein